MTVQSIGVWLILKRLWHLLSNRDRLAEPDARGLPLRSIFIRHVDAGSSNDCELEIAALANPIYNFERFGFRFVTSPRHADLLLVTGPLTRQMEVALLAAFRAMPEPRRVVTAGDGFEEDNVFRGSYATVPLPAEVAAARVAHIPGDPPSPQQILEKLLNLY